ncbi:hypothetical protein, partial [Kingella denitrificans]
NEDNTTNNNVFMKKLLSGYGSLWIIRPLNNKGFLLKRAKRPETGGKKQPALYKLIQSAIYVHAVIAIPLIRCGRPAAKYR